MLPAQTLDELFITRTSQAHSAAPGWPGAPHHLHWSGWRLRLLAATYLAGRWSQLQSRVAYSDVFDRL
jgi:hypothetical protein